MSRARPDTYHFEGIELLLDLLGQHWCQAVAGSDLAPTVILLAGPSIVKNDSWREGSIALRAALRCDRCTLSVLTQSEGRHKIILVTNSD